MSEYGLREPECLDMEIALRINLYRAESEASWNTERTLENVGKVKEERKMHNEKKCTKTKKCAQSALKFKLSAQEQIIVEYIAENGMGCSGGYSCESIPKKSEPDRICHNNGMYRPV